MGKLPIFQRTVDDELAAAKARIAELEEALRPFAEESKEWNKFAPDSLAPYIGAECEVEQETAKFTVGDLRRADKLLEGESK